MNQIIVKIKKTEPRKKNKRNKNNFKIEFSNEILEIPYEETKKNNSSKKKVEKHTSQNKYRLQFIISITAALIFLIIFYYHIQNLNKQEKHSKELLNNYSLTTLYQDNILDASIIKQQANIVENPFVIGMIRISEINLNYPILSQSNSDLLKISLCRFAGPMPNENGNLCIAGHNYVDNKFFSRLSELEKNDEIEIYDLTGKKIVYSVFDKYEVESDDLSCTDQNVGENKVITLLTCNNVNGKRTIVRATENNIKE